MDVTGPQPAGAPRADAGGLRDRLHTALGARYTIERQLGRGGMATVFLAHDVKHDRSVAIKVLHPELAASLGTMRFRREITLAAKLQHPHILTVLDSGETPTGEFWFTMPYVEGESLRDRLIREGRLSLDGAITIAREVADALDYAHARRVIHRDVKPENILLADGHALLADFGVARPMDPPPAGGDSRMSHVDTLTDAGFAVGSPVYMSPEQSSGERTLDGRSDIYSLATVLYEMLAGEAPFAGPGLQGVIVKRMTTAPPSIRVVRPSVPVAVDVALHKALALVPGDRFATASAFSQALATGATTAVSPAAGHRVPVLAAIATVLVLVVGGAFAWRVRARHPVAGLTTLAVLPFDFQSESAHAYFADGITDEVRGKLAGLAGLQVIASSSSNQYRRTTKSPDQIGRELGVRYLLMGRIQWENLSGGQIHVRVMPELVQVADVHSPTTRWEQPFDADLSDVFQVQAEIATQVASALNVALGAPQHQVLDERPTSSLDAYDVFLKGEAASQNLNTDDAPSLRRAIGFYTQAVALDSTFALAWAHLARAYAHLYDLRAPTLAEAAVPQHAVARAQTLAPGRPETQLALGTYYLFIRGDNSRGLAAFDAGLAQAPDNVDLLSSAALAERLGGQWDQALAHVQRAEALDPRSARAARQLGITLLYLRRFPEALVASDHALTLVSTNVQAIENKAMVYLGQGDLAGAKAVLNGAPPEIDSSALAVYVVENYGLSWVLNEALQQRLLSLPPGAFDDDRGRWAIARAQVYWLRGERGRARIYADTARRVLEAELVATPQDDERRVELGLALAYLGRNAEAIQQGARGAALLPISRDAFGGPTDQAALARIYVIVGEPEKALDQLEPLVRIPCYLSPGWLRLDPNYAPLHGRPRFERLIARS